MARITSRIEDVVVKTKKRPIAERMEIGVGGEAYR